MKYRIIKKTYGKVSLYYVQYKKFLCWKYFEEMDLQVSSVATFKVVFDNLEAAKQYIDRERTRAQNKVTKEIINYD